MSFNEDYRKALKRERDRDRQKRKTGQGAFEAGMLHYDDPDHIDIFAGSDDDDDVSPGWLTDHGLGLERMLDELDRDYLAEQEREYLSEYNRRKAAFIKFLRRHDPLGVPVFKLVCENRSNRKESIKCLAEMIRKGEIKLGRGGWGKTATTRHRTRLSASIRDKSKKC